MDTNSKVINCVDIANRIKNEVKMEIHEHCIEPMLVVILVGDDYASQVYVGKKQEVCQEVGIKSEVIKLPSTTRQKELIEIIDKLNNDIYVQGILVQLPLPSHIDKELVVNRIHKNKDVDCLNAYNVGKLCKKNKFPIYPCTPLGCIEILKQSNIELSGKHCVIIGRSDIVGKPLVNMLLAENATVTICHSKTKDMEVLTRLADIVIIAIGKPKFLKKEMIKKGAIVIDVGINRDENNKLCGDVDFDDVIGTVDYITPVPRGVGVLTTALLTKNCLINYWRNTK